MKTHNFMNFKKVINQSVNLSEYCLSGYVGGNLSKQQQTQEFTMFTVFPSFGVINFSSSNFLLYCEELIEDTFIVVGGGLLSFLHIMIPESTSPSQGTPTII